jgi:ankyrin repeat protein
MGKPNKTNRKININDIFREYRNGTLEKYLKQVDVNEINDGNLDWDYTMLHTFTYRNDIEIVKALLDAGANPNIQNKYGYTALIYAIENNNNNIASLLIKSGTDTNIKDTNDIPALLYAVERNNIILIQTLLKANADSDIKDKWNRTILVESINNNNYTIVKTLLRKSIDKINISSALLSATRVGNIKIIALLLKKGADVNFKNGWKTSLIISLMYGRRKIIKELLKYNPSIENIEKCYKNCVNEDMRNRLQKNLLLIYSSKFIPFFSNKFNKINENIIREAISFL